MESHTRTHAGSSSCIADRRAVSSPESKQDIRIGCGRPRCTGERPAQLCPGSTLGPSCSDHGSPEQQRISGQKKIVHAYTSIAAAAAIETSQRPSKPLADRSPAAPTNDSAASAKNTTKENAPSTLHVVTASPMGVGNPARTTLAGTDMPKKNKGASATPCVQTTSRDRRCASRAVFASSPTASASVDPLSWTRPMGQGCHDVRCVALGRRRRAGRTWRLLPVALARSGRMVLGRSRDTGL